MSYDLRDMRYNPTTWVITLEDGDRLLSWGLLYKMNRKPKYGFEVYTRVCERQKGYGKMVYDAAVNKFTRARINVFPHDNRSIKFFNSVHYPINRKIRLHEQPAKATS